MLHIHNGDSSANTAKQITIPGEHVAFRESLIEGPTSLVIDGRPIDLYPGAWRLVRARHLAHAFGADLIQTSEDLRAQEEKLKSFYEHDEVVLWFEHDLFCQVNLLYLLDWFAQRELGPTKLSLIFIGEFPGLPNFRGLGELNPEQLASLLDKRQEVSAAQFALATRAWQAYGSDDPTAIEQLRKSDTSALPFLDRAMLLHLERFPSSRNGLGLIENLGLELIQSGSNRFADLFPRFSAAAPEYGFGDSQFWLALSRLAAGRKPLVKSSSGNTLRDKSNSQFYETAFEITETGAAVARNEADFVKLNHIDTWLGGVHLYGQKDVWRWDENSQSLTKR